MLFRSSRWIERRKYESRLSKTPFTRDRKRLISTFSSVTLRSHLLLPLFLWYVLIKFCNIITNLRVMLVLKLVKLYGDHTDPVLCERGLSSAILFRRSVLGRCFQFIIALNSFTLAMKTSF